MSKQTPLYKKHVAAGAKIIDFGGWDMPLHYGSQLEEHHLVRKDSGMFDVSHMTVIDITGPQAFLFLRFLLANDVAKLTHDGKALYTCMLNPQGGVIDDLIVYKRQENNYRLVVNASTREKDLQWIIEKSKPYDVKVKHRDDLGIIAIQGPQAIEKVASLFSAAQKETLKNLKPFNAVEIEPFFIGRTGYTGEDGFEIIVPFQNIESFWEQLLAAGIKPCGLGARDTLRLEAGLNLYGSDMDENTTPLESNLSWTVALDPRERDFIGRTALENIGSQNKWRLVGLVLEERGVLRNHQKVIVPDIGEGEITSGSFSPTLQQAIALARVPAATGERCFVDIRGQQVSARVIKPPFVRHGKKMFE
jgi:aminomethyltransferase